MKNLLFTLTVFILFTTVIFSQPDTLTILHVNDTHSCLSSLGPRGSDLEGTQGGIARAATIIGMTRMNDPNVTLLHSGDVFIGDLFFNVYFGAAEFQLMNNLGFDAMELGNHEFDLTPSTLLGALQASFLPGEGFPIISSNLILEDPTLAELKNYVTQYTIIQKRNIKIGLFGLLTSETNLLSLPSPAIVDTNIFPIAAAMVDTLLSQNCDVIICLSHLGFLYDEAIANNIPGINIIARAHDHYLFEQPVPITNPANKTTLIIQDGAFYSSISKMQLLIDGGEVSLLNFSNIPLDNNVPEEPSVKAVVTDLIAGIEAQYQTPFYTSEMGIATDYFKEVADSLMYPGFHDTPIGNLVTDAFLSVGQTDIAITVGGSTAQPLYAGYLVPADAFRVVGYGFNEVNGLGFRLETFDILGINLWTALEKSLAYIEYNDEFFVQVSGMSYEYNPTNDVGERLSSVQINGVELDFGQTYSVTTNEFVVAALSDPNFFNIPITNTNLFDSLSEFEVLYGYISAFGSISPVVEGRVANVLTNIDDESLTPKQFNLEQNYPNPFNPGTIIKFSIPSSGYITLKIFNALGEGVTVLLEKELTTGTYEIEWNASELPSGVYFYQLKTEGFVETKKMIFIK